MRVQLRAGNWEDGIQNQFLKTICNDAGECCWSVVVQFGEAGFLGDRNDARCFPEGRDSCSPERLNKNRIEQHSCDPIWM